MRDPDAGSGIATIPRAVLINPCDVIDRALAAELTGTTTEPTGNQRGGAEQEACRYPAAEGGGVDLSISVVRNNNSGTVLNNWQERHANAIEVRAVPWSGEGELRIGDANEEFPLTLLWAYVFERPEWDSDLYIQVEAYVIDAPSISAAALTAGVETIGRLLNEALVEAQP